MNKTILVSNQQVKDAVSVADLIPVMDRVFEDISTGAEKVLPRNAVFHQNGNILAVMPSSDPGNNVCGCKTAIFPGPKTGDTVQSVIQLFNVDTGALKAIVSAEYITVARTAASTAAATDRMAKADAKILTLIGAGNQAVAHAEAICKIRNIEEIRVWSRTEATLKKTSGILSEKCPGCVIKTDTDIEKIVRGSDIICTVSKAKEPILFGDWIEPGCHINAIGACGPIFREIHESVLDKAQVYVDHMDTAVKMAGDLLIPAKEGKFSLDRILGEVGQFDADKMAERQKNPSMITLFESCGVAAQDIAAADYACSKLEAFCTFEF